MKNFLLNLVLILTLLLSINIHSQFSISNEKYNPGNCLISVDLNYSVNREREYRIFMYNSNGAIIKVINLGRKTRGSYSAGMITISSSLEFKMKEKSFFGGFRTLYTKKVVHCQNDLDSDGLLNINDNCPNNFNPNQEDLDNDGIGNICDNDIDGDGISNDKDACPTKVGTSLGEGCPDSDGDGVYDNEDECLNEVGVASNNGCPKPDLKFRMVLVSSSCSDCSSNLENLGSKRHKVARNGGILNISPMVIENIGEGQSKPAQIKYFFSLNRTFESSDIPFNISTDISPINKGAVKSVSQTIFGNDFLDKGMPYGNIYVIGKIDSEGKIDELNENNNTFVIPVTFTENLSSTKENPKDIFLLGKSSYKLNIYDSNGNLKKSYFVKDKNHEKEIISQLNLKGLYILKTHNSTRKIILK